MRGKMKMKVLFEVSRDGVQGGAGWGGHDVKWIILVGGETREREEQGCDWLHMRRRQRGAGDACTMNQLSKYGPCSSCNTPIHSLYKVAEHFLSFQFIFHSDSPVYITGPSSLWWRKVTSQSVTYCHNTVCASLSLLSLLAGSSVDIDTFRDRQGHETNHRHGFLSHSSLCMLRYNVLLYHVYMFIGVKVCSYRNWFTGE